MFDVSSKIDYCRYLTLDRKYLVTFIKYGIKIRIPVLGRYGYGIILSAFALPAVMTIIT